MNTKAQPTPADSGAREAETFPPLPKHKDGFSSLCFPSEVQDYAEEYALAYAKLCVDALQERSAQEAEIPALQGSHPADELPVPQDWPICWTCSASEATAFAWGRRNGYDAGLKASSSKDAERYRWLGKRGHLMQFAPQHPHDLTIDESIDQAMRLEEKLK